MELDSQGVGEIKNDSFFCKWKPRSTSYQHGVSMKQDDARKILLQGSNVLLTGAAGSGKTFLLESFARWKREQNCRVSVTATTGMAAANISGTTIHNWSGIGVRGRVELENDAVVNGIADRMQKKFKDAIIKSEILIIDEISGLHAYQLSAIDKIVRRVRKREEPFGGVQVVLCGDFFQLPPIQDKGDLQPVQFITESLSFKGGKFKVCYLEELFRQDKDDDLILVLNAIRSNQVTQAHWGLLNNRKGVSVKVATVTKICTVNDQADDINNKRISALPGEIHEYMQQEDRGNDPLVWQDLKRICNNKVVPALSLKADAIVMFVKNDPKGHYFNGSLGKVVSFSDDGWPNVQLNDKIENGEIFPGELLIGIKPVDFFIADENGQRLATIRQVPLRPAWAITVNKSQGMTLDAAEVDLGWVHPNSVGLGYVALSRVRSMQNLSLLNNIHSQALVVNPAAIQMERHLQELSEEAQKSLDGDDVVLQRPTRNTQFITTQGINYYLDELIKHAKQKIILITPYIKLNPRLQELLQEKKQEGVEIIFICKGDNRQEELAAYSTSVRVKTNLHAKCYFSEKEVVITSLNLYTFSQINNVEMGVYIKNDGANLLYTEVTNEVERLMFNSQVI